MRKRDPHKHRGARTVLRALGLALVALGATSACASAAAPEINASLSASESILGTPLSVDGHVLEAGAPVAGLALELQGSAYPYRGFAPIAQAVSTLDGSFAFSGLQLLLDMRLRVIAAGPANATSASLHATVEPAVALNALSLGSGRTRLSVRIQHDPQLASNSVSARWFLAARGTRSFVLAAVTQTRELASGITYASATVDPPAKRFVYRVCVNPAWELAMGAPGAHKPCPQHDYTVAHDVD
jgi:hypothetical protein